MASSLVTACRSLADHAGELAAVGVRAGLDADSLAFAQTALRLAQQGQIQEDAVKAVLERLEGDRAAVAAGAGLTEQFEYVFNQEVQW